MNPVGTHDFAPPPVAPVNGAQTSAGRGVFPPLTPDRQTPDRNTDHDAAVHRSQEFPEPEAKPVVAEQPPAAARMTKGARRVLSAVSIALGLVILAPIALSAQDLYDWAVSPTGLGLEDWWPYLVPVALDLAATACIGMTIVSAWRKDRAGVFSVLVWIFAGVSAYAQYTHGMAEKDAGRAQDAWWAMPAFALLGPLLLEVTLTRIRNWARKDGGEQHSGAAGFGSRWLPGVAFRETLAAWAVSRREGFDIAADAIQFVRDRKALAGNPPLPPLEAVHYAFGALGDGADIHAVRVWLSKRGRTVSHAALLAGRAARQAANLSTDTPPDGTDSGDPTGTDTPESTGTDSRPAPRTDKTRQQPTGRAAVKPTPRPTTPAPTGRPTVPARVANAAELRRRWPDGLPTDSKIRTDTGWSLDRVKPAREAYEAGDDLRIDVLSEEKSK